MRLVILVEAGVGWARYREELARAGVLVTDRLEIWLTDCDDAVPPELWEQEEYLRAAMSFPAPSRLPVHEETDLFDGRLA
jgi:hypothetical protein